VVPRRVVLYSLIDGNVCDENDDGMVVVVTTMMMMVAMALTIMMMMYQSHHSHLHFNFVVNVMI